jgi:hypothetical protein
MYLVIIQQEQSRYCYCKNVSHTYSRSTPNANLCSNCSNALTTISLATDYTMYLIIILQEQSRYCYSKNVSHSYSCSTPIQNCARIVKYICPGLFTHKATIEPQKSVRILFTMITDEYCLCEDIQEVLLSVKHCRNFQ